MYSRIYGYALAPFSTDIEQQTVGFAANLEKCQRIRNALAPFSAGIEQQTVGIATSLEKCLGITVNDRMNRQQGANLDVGLFDHLRLCSGTFHC